MRKLAEKVVPSSLRQPTLRLINIPDVARAAPRVAMVQPCDTGNRDDLPDSSRFDRPLFWNVLILARGVFGPRGNSQLTTGSRAEADTH